MTSENVACAWNSHTNRDVQKIEKVQNRALHFAMHDFRQTTRFHAGPYKSPGGGGGEVLWGKKDRDDRRKS